MDRAPPPATSCKLPVTEPVYNGFMSGNAFNLARLGLFFLLLAAWPARADTVEVLTVQGPISPASADYLVRGLAHAAQQKATLVVIELDTPGGLDNAMRDIIKAILASPVPVATFVHPQGARAASAGTYILYASHIAAMAPATNLGAATPVAIGGAPAPAPGRRPDPKEAEEKAPPPPADAMAKKQMHDAAAYIRGLAELRGRNAEWAEQAVREAVSLSAQEALDKKVIDLVADDVADLLRQLDGRTIKTAQGEVTVKTRDARVVQVTPDWRTKLLAVIADPSVAYMLLMLGIYGLFFEFSNPGFGVPGVLGGICLLLALFALQLLPISYAGLALIVLGLAFMVAEAFAPSFGILGIGGLIAFIAGSVMLIDTGLPGYGVPWALILPVALGTALFVFFVVGMALRARRQRIATGREEMIGATGEVLEDMQHEGWAHIHGETWRVVSKQPLARGTQVRVTAMDGLTLQVEPLKGA